MAYQPNQGDIIILDFNPQTGHEQAGRRPALIVSNAQYHKYTNGLALVCPVTNTLTPFPLHIPLDNRTKTTGVIMCEQVKALDLNARQASFVEPLPEDLLHEVMERIVLSVE
jgi:mRNA interferase MazF